MHEFRSTRRLQPLGALLLVMFILLVPGSRTPAAQPPEDSLRVLVWNVLHGANDVDQGAEKALAIIRDSKADTGSRTDGYLIRRTAWFDTMAHPRG